MKVIYRSEVHEVKYVFTSQQDSLKSVKLEYHFPHKFAMQITDSKLWAGIGFDEKVPIIICTNDFSLFRLKSGVYSDWNYTDRAKNVIEKHIEDNGYGYLLR